MPQALTRSVAKAAEGIQQAGKALPPDTGLPGSREAAAELPMRHFVVADQVSGPGHGNV